MLHWPPRSLRHIGANAGAAEAQLVVGVQQGADIELVAHGFHQHALLVQHERMGSGAGAGASRAAGCGWAAGHIPHAEHDSACAHAGSGFAPRLGFGLCTRSCLRQVLAQRLEVLQ
jgi:hypothetical protein